MQQVPESEAEAPDVDRSITKRWGGHESMKTHGYVPVPNDFLRYHSKLKPRLKPTEAMFVLHLMSYKWDRNAPYPGYKTLASRLGVSQEYARKLARQVEKKGYLRRVMREAKTNKFNLQPLFDAIAKAASDAAGAKAPKYTAVEEDAGA